MMMMADIREVSHGENELITLDSLGSGGAVQKYSDEDFEELQSTPGFLPRIQLMTSRSSMCEEGKFPINNFALIAGKEDYQDLGAQIDVLVCAWRPMALQIGEQTVATYDRSSETFQNIQEKSASKDSGCMFGVQFLVWVPAVRGFATVFMGTKSARIEAATIKARLHNRATLKSKRIKTSKYTWFVTTAIDCSTPFDMPTKSDFEETIERFNNPTESNVEVASEDERSQ